VVLALAAAGAEIVTFTLGISRLSAARDDEE
jgi:hypothetical protein